MLSIYDLFVMRGLEPMKKHIHYFVTKPILWMAIIGNAMHLKYPIKLDDNQDWLVRSVFIVSTHVLTVIHFSTQAHTLLTTMLQNSEAKPPARKKSSKKLTN